VPGDLSVIGGDDVPMAAVTSPPLTAVALPTDEAGAEAIRMVRAGGPTVDLASSFVVRGSTGPVTEAR